jgi:hypothetical protein
MPEFNTPGPVTVSLRLAGGGAEIIAEDRDTAVVEVAPDDNSDASHEAAANTRVELRGDTLYVDAPEWTGWLFRRGPKLRVTARVPNDGPLVVKVASADVRATGRYAQASINTASGDIAVEHVTGDATANSASGDLAFGRVDGQLRLNSASGDTSTSYVGADVVAHSASGDIHLGYAGASVRANTASGDITIGTSRTGTVRVNSASGDVQVGVAAGTGVWLDLNTFSGDARSDLASSGAPQGAATLTVQIRTMSGDIDVHRVADRAPGASGAAA